MRRFRGSFRIRHAALALLLSALLQAYRAPENVAAEDSSVDLLSPNRRVLFFEDLNKVKRARQKEVQQAIVSDKPHSQELDFKADDVKFNKETNEVEGHGKILISREGLQVQADQAKVNMTTKDAQVSGNMLMTHSGGILSADHAELNLDTETGKFFDTDMTIEDGAYHAEAGITEKLSDVRYNLFGCKLSTCQCKDGTRPWEIYSREAHVTQESYAHTYGTKLSFYGVPLLYTPYFAFPVKQERQSGLLVPTYSFSKGDGFGLKLPLFLVLDDSTDMTLTPFTETKTRNGSFVDFRKAFSKRDFINSRFLYSNESPRGDALRGTVTTGMFDPTFDQNRVAGFYDQAWSTEQDADVPLAFAADLHYVSDDLIPREIEDEDIAQHDSRYVTSTMLARAGLGDFALAELSGEYNQAMLEDDQLIFQRLPEFNIYASKSVRPFGFNPYGIKLVPSVRGAITQFDRDRYYDGTRSDLYPSVRLPFHYQNYLSAEMSVGYRDTFYALQDRTRPGTDTLLDSSDQRQIGNAAYSMSTSIERVYDLDEGNSLTYLTSLGSKNQDNKLVRVKHLVEPFFKYNYVPDVSQDELPFFDSLDRLREKSLFTFGARTSLLGRFTPRRESADAITELTPPLEELPTLRTGQPLSDLGELDTFGDGSYGLRRGEVRELAYFTVKQAYDYTEDKDNNDPLRSAWSDTYMDLMLNPSSSFGFRFDTNYGFEDHNVSSWGVTTYLFDDRGDALRSRYSFVENNISQVEGNLELVLTDRLRLGYYARYDDVEAEFIENRIGLRLASSCDCWSFDLGVSDKINPDRQQIFLTFTFAGLGDITQNFGMGGSNK